MKISELTGVSRNTIKKYLKTYARLGLTIAYVEEKSDQELDHLFGEKTIADAILDRIVHDVHRIEPKGESKRKIRAKETEALN